MNNTLRASQTPVADIDQLAYDGQEFKMRMYRSGYESLFDQMPKLIADDPLLKQKITFAQSIMNHLGDQLTVDNWIRKNMPSASDFDRTILAVEKMEPRESLFPIEPEDIPARPEGSEFVLARWGSGFSSPVHGHAPGLLYERLIFGRMLVNYYQMTERTSNIVRPLFTKLFVGSSEIVSSYVKPDNKNYFKRQATIHNFTSVGNSASLHYVAEHTRDGRDNQFLVQHFEDYYNLDQSMMKRITSNQAHYSNIGDVILVRSSNVPEYGVHFIVVTGPPILKPHGLRIQEEAIMISPSNKIMDEYGSEEALVLLKLNDTAAYAFREFHNIKLGKGKSISFSEPI